MRYLAAILLCLTLRATEPDAATRRWWSHVTALANDGLEGRDTGSEGYRKAAQYVATQFERAGLKAAGESGYYQTVPLHMVRLRADRSAIELVRGSTTTKLAWFRQVTIAANPALPETLDSPLVFAGSDPIEAAGKIVVRLNRGRGAAPVPEGAAGVLTVDATGGPEPAHWPVAYAVSMTLAGANPAARAPLTMRFNPAYADLLFEGSGHTYKQLSDLAAGGSPLPSFALPAHLRTQLRFETSDVKSDNILAVLPGSDPALAKEYVVVSAHLDGYGTGEPWNGDRIYNGAFDDAAYVATLIDLAEKLHASGTRPKRSILFAVVTGEEKGLLGSRYFTQHLTVPKESMVANINLDQLRPIFPLKILTTLALDESSLGATVKRVAQSMDIRIQPDPEPERNLLRRSDHYNFMQIGVPAAGFIFGYEKGSPEEAIYRRWYAERYHSPADDLRQPWDPAAAAKFNLFFGRVVEAIANDPERPRWKPGSTFGVTQ
jgi:hypothetical protein